MDELKNRLPAYGQHFDCMAQLIRSGVTFKLLQHLLDRYIMMYRLESVEDVKIHYQTVARKIGADRRTIKSAIDDLLRMQFISISENKYRINIKTILGVVFAFDAIDKKDIDLQIEFADALNDGGIIKQFQALINIILNHIIVRRIQMGIGFRHIYVGYRLFQRRKSISLYR